MKIIAICREYGACGHTVGRMVAEKLGIEVYDKDIVRSAAHETGITENDILAREEVIRKSDSFIRAISPSVTYNQIDMIHDREKEAILRFAQTGPCVVVGRCADVILRDAGYDVLTVFLHASEVNRRARVSELIGTDNPSAVHKAIKSTDSAREAYYKYFTEKAWGDYANYDLMLDVGTLGPEKCTELICAAAR